jgi:hypothetical protein
MEGILIVLAILALIALGRTTGVGSRRGGYIVKDNPASKKPKIGAAPQPLKPKRNKQGRTKEEQELHEWMEDNPR